MHQVNTGREDDTASHGKQQLGTSFQLLVAMKRPDSGGTQGTPVPLVANHFRVEFDSSQPVFHYDINISPSPSKEISRLIKQNFDKENSQLSGSFPVFDGRRNLYSPIRFQSDRLDFLVNLPLPASSSAGCSIMPQRHKLFKVSIKLVSRLNGADLVRCLTSDEADHVSLPQEYLHALDVVLREYPTENCIPVERSFYSRSMGEERSIGGGAVGLGGFFQSLRPTQQGLALNVDFSVAAFHESISIIQYLQRRFNSLRDLAQRKTRTLMSEERKEVEKALRNIRIFVCHRDTDQRFKVFSLTSETTENLRFENKDGKLLRVVDYFKQHYNHDIQFRNLPCLQISRSKPCYLPMELCIVCEGQKYVGKLSDEQTRKILQMGCQKPRERMGIIKSLMQGDVGPTSDKYAKGFKLHVSQEMTKLNGRLLSPPRLRLGRNGRIRDITPSNQDRQWNMIDSHVLEAVRINTWALISFGGTPQQHSCIPRFIFQLAQRCEQLGITLSQMAIRRPQFEPIQALNNASKLETILRDVHEAASGNLQLVICVMEKKHKGYADLKRIAETKIGVISQCCLYHNLSRLSSQFLTNLALKINAKAGGSTVALFNTMPWQNPRLFADDEPAMFMGADVTHPHPLDDYSPSIAAVVGSMNWPAANKYISRMRSQRHRQEIILDLQEMVEELLDDFCHAIGKHPKQIIFFRDGVSETQFYKVLQEELRAIKSACQRIPDYNPSITFVVVQKRHHTRLFLDERCSKIANSHGNIPPGTIVDTVITHPKEFDFFLCSHSGLKGTSRPTHYHVLWDESHFSSDELQQLIHNLCYTFVRCTKPVSLVPPAYYAHLAAYRGRMYLERAVSVAMGSSPSRFALSRPAPPLMTIPLPKPDDKVKKLMFYC
ncbi:unnamed protein product [Victoria cruziana]